MDNNYSIYRIVNFQNGACYVGQTVDTQTRKQTHFRGLKRGTHFNKHLQRAYDKYGRSAFYFEILETGIDYISIDNREIFWISHFDSFRNGYNMTAGGNSPTCEGTSCKWNDVIYSTVASAARDLGITSVAMWLRIKQNYKCDADVYSNRKPCYWNGIQYPSEEAAEKALDLTGGVMHYRVKKGWVCDTDIPSNKKPCVWNDVEYPSIKAAANANNISHVAMMLRLSSGYKSDNDMNDAKSNRINKRK